MADERNPDKAMAGMLKRKSVWPPACGEPGRTASTGEACPDAATLAAYFERALTPSEISLCETHFAACARCQEQLAALVRSEPASAAKPVVEKKPAFSWLWDWRWMAPIGASVVALAFFISYQTMRAPARAPGGGELVARRDVATQAPAIAEPQKSADADSAKQLEKGRSAADEFQRKKAAAAVVPAQADQAFKDKSAPSAETASGAVASRAPAKPAAEEKQVAAAENRVTRVQPPPPAVSAAAPAETAKTQQRIAEADRAQAAPAQDAAPGVQALQKQERAAVAAETKERAALAQPWLPAGQQAAAGKQEGAVAKKALADSRLAVEATPDYKSKVAGVPSQFIVATPNSKVLWRFGPSGLIERTRDAGKTWERQKGPAQDNFLSGWAPSESICWVGGSNGVLLRTIDGGENWERIPSPTQGDIIAVKARDQFHVTVVDSDGRTFETPNSGRLWRTP